MQRKESNVVCTNVFKNLDEEKLTKEFNDRWINIINKLEKNSGKVTIL